MVPAAVPIERLDFVLPDFRRLSWVSDAAREVWEPRLHRITKAWLRMEWLAVVMGVRRCGVTLATPDEFIAEARGWASRGLSALPLEIESGTPLAFRIVLGRHRDLSDFVSAWDGGDNRTIAELLGHPRCCFDFLQAVSFDQHLMDTTWPMAVATARSERMANTVDVSGSREVNILWRWMGIRAVPHLPCSFDCSATVDLAKRFCAVGRAAGYEQEMNWLLEILSWPVEWSALHGIAEIKTPVLKVSTRTDATRSKYVVRRQGEGYPAEGAQGLTFPYRLPVRSPVIRPILQRVDTELQRAAASVD